MATYSEWLGSTKTAFANAMSSAYTNRNTAGNDFYLAWQDMTATSDLNSILPPGSTAFWNTGGPTAVEADILLFRDWLQDNPVTAGRLGLEPTLAFRSQLRSSLGNAGTVNGEKRRWKGNPLYTFANGIVVGKDGNIAAALGTEGGTNIEGFGTDTISFFDGIPFSTGTGIPGSTVFGGDTVHSGSIRGTGGVVIIPDVIQLEQDDSITSPAGIGVDADGKIRLRHRGEGFLDLVDEIANAETDATNASKLFTAAQNTSSGRWGMSLVPNSNFSYKSIHPTTFAESFANIISVGTTSNILTESSPGVGQFEANEGGICFTAFPTTSERYAVRIRFEGDVEETADDTSASEGLFVTFNETTDDLPDGKYYIFNDPNVGPNSGQYQGSEVHTGNVTVVIPPLAEGGYATTDAGGNTDGLTIPTSMSVASFLYKPSAGAKNASMVIFAKNFGANTDRSIRIDYIVVNESPQTTGEIDLLIDNAVSNITDEDDISIVPDKHMADKTQWATRGTSVTLTDSDDGGDPAEDAIQAVFGHASGGGIISSAIGCESDRYVVGCKVKVSAAPSGSPQISMFAMENLTPSYPTVAGADTSPITTGYENGIDIMEVTSGNNYHGTSESYVTVAADSNFHTLIGTYETTVTYMDIEGTTYNSYDPSRTPHGTTPIQLPSVFSLGIQVDRPCTLLIDYVYGRIQASSVNIVEGLATAAYTDAEGFVTAMNELVIKESGSIITNSSMALLDSNGKPSGWRTTTDNTLTFDDTGDYAITISQAGSGTRTLISPPFAMGTADKFSIGVRIKSTTSSAIDPTIKIISCSDDLLPTTFVTLGVSSGTYPADVYTTNTTEADSDLTMTPGSGIVAYESMLGTWSRTSEGAEQAFVGGLANIHIECADDFTVDYVFVKEQTVSYDLADARAEARKDEAIAQAAGFVADIGDSIAQETGSLITNADFNSWYIDNSLQRPQKWLATRATTNLVRVIKATEVPDDVYNAITDPVTGENTSRDAETIDNVTQAGSSARFSPSTGSGGILSAKWQLPIQDESGVAAGTATTGAYTIAARVKVGSASVIGVRIYAHESFEYVDGGQEHVFCEDGTYGSATVEGADRTASGTPLDSLYMFADGVTTGQVTRVSVINISNPNDTTPGYDPNYTNDDVDNDYVDAGDDQYVEYIPIDNNGMGGYEDGDLDATIENTALWYDIGGTYKPDPKTKHVSFEILIDGDPDATDGAPDYVYVDYVSLVQQPFDSDFAITLADARVESITGITSESFGSTTDPTTGGTNTTLAAAILANQARIYSAQQALAAEDETTTLIPNSFFGSPTTGTTPDNWLATRNTDGTIVREMDTAAWAAAGSYNSYITLGGTNNGRGILSKAISVIGDGGENTLGLTTGQLTQNPNFDIAVRYRAATGNVTSSTTGLEVTPESYTNGSYLSPTSDAPTSITNGYGDTLAVTVSEEYVYDVAITTRNAVWSVGYDSAGLNVDQTQVTELVIVYRVNDLDCEYDPRLNFFDSQSNPVHTSGTVEIWDAANTKLHDNAFTNQKTILDFETPTNATAGSFLAGGIGYTTDGPPYWVVVKITQGAKDVDGFAIIGQDSATSDNLHVSNLNMFVSTYTTEPITFSIIAHEYFDTNYDPSTYSYVLGGGFDYASGATGVQEFNSGFQGQIQMVGAILNDGVDTTVENSTVTDSGAWQTLVGLYTPHTLARWVSFEFHINHDQDNDTIIPEVYIDGILLQASQQTPLLQSVKETAEAAAVAAGNAESTANETANDVTAIELAQTEAAIVQAGIASEQGSILFNAGFTQSISAANKALPKGFFPFQETPHLFRITNETGTQTSSDLASWGTQGTDQTFNETSGLYESTKSIYLDVGQTGSALVVTGTDRQDPYTSGFYTTAIPLPAVTADVISTTDGSTTAQADRGNYSIAIKVKPAGTNPVSVQLRGIEVNTTMDPESYVHTAYLNNVYHLYGYDADWNTDAGAPTADSYSNYIPLVKISESDTTASGWEIIQPNQWTTLIGTFTPQATSQFASFALWFTHSTDNEEADPTAESTPDGPAFWDDWTFGSTDYTQRALVYVDFILVTPATVSANLANDIAAGKAYEVQQTLISTIESVEEGINEQTPGLIFNSDFKNIISAGSKAKGWLAAYTNQNYIESKPYNSNVGSIDRYVHLQKGGTGQYASLISKGVGAITDESRNADGSLGTYVIAVKARGKYVDGTNTFSQTNPTTSHLEQYQIHRVSGGTSSSGATSNVVLPSDAGSYLGWYDDDNYALNERGSTTVYRRYPTPGGTHDGVFKFPVPGKTVKFWVTLNWDGVDTSGDSIKFVPITNPEGTYALATNGVTSEIRYCRDTTREAGSGSSLTVYNDFELQLRDIVNQASTTSAQYFLQITMTADEQIEGFQLVTTNLDSGEKVQMGALYQVYSETSLDGDFSVKMYAHESNTPGSATHVVNSGTTFETPHTDLGITTVNSDNSVALTIIDLGYGSAEADTEAEILNEESSLDTWRTIIGSYKPTSEDRRMTSFEFFFDMDEDGDSLYQQIYIDSVTLLKSAIDGDVAEEIAENRVFLESNQTMGGATVSNNNILFNADFSMPQGTTSATRSPAGWYPLRRYGYYGTDITSGVPLKYSGSNRDLRFNPADQCHGAVSKAFSIDYDKYRVRLTLDLNGATNTDVTIRYFATTGTPSFAQKVICHAYYWPSVNTVSYKSASTTGYVQNGVDSGSGVYTVEYEWNPYGSTGSWENAWNWASLAVYFNGADDADHEIIIKSFEVYPIGHPFTRTPTGRGALSRSTMGALFLFGGRSQVYETDVPDPLYDAIDIAVDTDTSVDTCLMMSEVRYEYQYSDGSGTKTAKYKYPAESPFTVTESSGYGATIKGPDSGYSRLQNFGGIWLSNNSSSDHCTINCDQILYMQGDRIQIELGPLVVQQHNNNLAEAGLFLVPYNTSNDDHTWQLYASGDSRVRDPDADADSNDTNALVSNSQEDLIFAHSNTSGEIKDGGGTSWGGHNNPDYWDVAARIGTTGVYVDLSFTGQHRNVIDEEVIDPGLIVVSTGVYNNIDPNGAQTKPSINEALPVLKLSSKRNQKSAFGVVADESEDGDNFIKSNGNFYSHLPKRENDAKRFYVNSLGEGGVWICNINGNLENGDYITTCEIPGYGMLQDDDLLHNYTVAKITQDCNFELDNPHYDCVEFEFEGNTYRKAFVGCTYHCG